MKNHPNQRPPKWADDFLAWSCDPEFIDEVQGDLHEAFHKRRIQNGLRYAKLLFLVDVVRSISLRRTHNSFRGPKNSGPMFKNYLTISSRSLLRNKVFSLINVLGLAIGMASCFLIIQYVRFEWSYDRFHQNHDRIYRVYLDHTKPTSHLLTATVHPGIGPALKAEFPEVEEYARMLPQSIRMGNMVALSYVDEKNNQKIFYEENIYIVDPTYLTVLSFPLKYGNPEDALVDPSSIVISESIAHKYFGEENPIGKLMMADGERSFKVTGVLKDIPGNSHIKFDILVSWWFMESDREKFDQDGHWKWPEFYTYIRLAPNVNIKNFEAKLENFLERHNGEFMKSMNFTERIRLQALTNIHLRSPEMMNEREVHGSERMVYFLLLIAALILLIAWINYINLSTSKSVERAKEVGLRKVVGALKRQLVVQFLFESAIVNLIAIVLSLVVTFIVYPYFNHLTGKNMGDNLLNAGLLLDPIFWFALTGIFVTGSFLAGLYPAFVLSSFKIVTVLKGRFFGSQSGIALRKALVGSQFIISVGLIAGTIMIYRQVEFMRNHELGYDKQQLLVVKGPRVADSTFYSRYASFKTEIKRNPAIHNITLCSEIPGGLVSQRHSIRKFHEGTEGNTVVYQYYTDNAFAPTLGVKIIAGRNFTDDERLISPDAKSNPIMLNRKVIETLGYKNADEAINQLVYFGLGDRDWVGEIVGVMENFSQRSLKTDYEPLIFFRIPYGAYFTINLKMSDVSETIKFLDDEYKKAFPGNPFDYDFMDDHFNRQYAADQQFGKVFGLFSGLALTVAGLGLFGLSTFMISRRSKEIAVRRVLGASISSMVALFSRDFVRLIFIANLIALPAVYFLIERWLSGFAFRINIGWVVFVIPALILLVISLVTVGFQTIKSGSTNPVESLKAE